MFIAMLAAAALSLPVFGFLRGFADTCFYCALLLLLATSVFQLLERRAKARIARRWLDGTSCLLIAVFVVPNAWFAAAFGISQTSIAAALFLLLVANFLAARIPSPQKPDWRTP